MKYQNRVRSNHSATPSVKQARANPSKPATVVFRSPDGNEFCRVDFPAAVFAAISAGRKRLGVSLDKFFELAIERKLTADGIALRTSGTIHQIA